MDKNYRITGQADGGVEVAFEAGRVHLTKEQVDDIVATREPTTCIGCTEPFTGDNPPAKVVCENCVRIAQLHTTEKVMDEIKDTQEKFEHYIVDANKAVLQEVTSAAKKAMGPNPPLALPKGKYVVVDPCYVNAIEEGGYYSRICDITCGREGHGYIEVEGKPVFAFTTAYGDGCYPVYSGGVEVGKSGVDSGQLAFVPVELLEQGCDENDPSQVTLERDTTVEQLDNRGDYEAGKVKVYTSGDDPYEDDDDDEYPHGQCENCGEPLSWNDDELCEDCQTEAYKEENEDDEE